MCHICHPDGWWSTHILSRGHICMMHFTHDDGPHHHHHHHHHHTVVIIVWSCSGKKKKCSFFSSCSSSLHRPQLQVDKLHPLFPPASQWIVLLFSCPQSTSACTGQANNHQHTYLYSGHFRSWTPIRYSQMAHPQNLPKAVHLWWTWGVFLLLLLVHCVLSSWH